MRALAVGSGLALYLLFAGLVLWLHLAGPGDRVPHLGACAGDRQAASVEVPFYRLLDRPESLRLCGTAPADAELLVLPRVSGNALAIRVDGELRHRIGAPDRPANLWLQPQVVALDGGSKGERTLEIELFGLYDLGLRVPPLLTAWATGGRRAALLGWLNGDLVSLASGANFGVGLLLFAYGLRRRRERREYLLFGLASICAAVYMLDFHPSTGTAGVALYLLRRKLSLAGAYFTVACLVSGLEHAAASRRKLGTLAIAVAGALSILVLVQPDAAALKRASSWAAALSIPIMIYGVGVAARRLEPVYAALWVFFGAAAVHVLVNVGFDHGHLFLLQFGILAGTFAAGARSAMQLTRVARDLEQASRAAMTDPLTGARNRAFFEQLRLAATDVVALVDFDDFKRVNDELGHPRGDRLLVDFVHAARTRLRANDHVVRLGGDEFALVLRQTDPRGARSICTDILRAWSEASTDLAPTASFGLAQLGASSLEQALAIADARMYDAKAVRSHDGAPPAQT